MGLMRKPGFSICENKDADQLRSNCAADQRLCFRYTDSNIPLLSKFKILSLLPSSMAVQPGLCWTRSETPKTGFLTTRLISYFHGGLGMKTFFQPFLTPARRVAVLSPAHTDAATALQPVAERFYYSCMTSAETVLFTLKTLLTQMLQPLHN